MPGSGWSHLIKPVTDYCKKHHIKIIQIKEKFGSLRIYIDEYTPELVELINKAEAESEKTCEKCGEPGYIAGPGWVKCFCEQHHNERQTRK